MKKKILVALLLLMALATTVNARDVVESEDWVGASVFSDLGDKHILERCPGIWGFC